MDYLRADVNQTTDVLFLWNKHFPLVLIDPKLKYNWFKSILLIQLKHGVLKYCSSIFGNRIYVVKKLI